MTALTSDPAHRMLPGWKSRWTRTTAATARARRGPRSRAARRRGRWCRAAAPAACRGGRAGMAGPRCRPEVDRVDREHGVDQAARRTRRRRGATTAPGPASRVIRTAGRRTRSRRDRPPPAPARTDPARPEQLQDPGFVLGEVGLLGEPVRPHVAPEDQVPAASRPRRRRSPRALRSPCHPTGVLRHDPRALPQLAPDHSRAGPAARPGAAGARRAGDRSRTGTPEPSRATVPKLVGERR